MKRTLKKATILSVVFYFIFSGVVSSQVNYEDVSPEKFVTSRMQILIQRLELNPDQVLSLRTIKENLMTKMEDKMSTIMGDTVERTKMFNSTFDEIEAILQNDQKLKFKTLRERWSFSLQKMGG